MLLAILYIGGVIYFSYKKPEIGIVLAINAFIINAIIGSDESGPIYNLVGAGAPFLSFAMILAKSVFIDGGEHYKFGMCGVAVWILFIILLTSAIYANSPKESLNVAFRYLVLCASYFYICFFIFVKNKIESLKLIALTSLYFSVFVSLYMLIFGVSSSEYITRMTIGTSSPIPISIVLGEGFLIAWYYLISEKGKYNLLLYTVMLGLIGYALLLTNTRSTLIGVVLSMLFSFIAGKGIFSFKAYNKMLAMLVLSVMGVFIIVVTNYDLVDRLFSGFSRIITGNVGQSEGDRLEAWNYAFDMFLNAPLLGIGAGNFGQYYIAYPHNILLELLSENGVLGLSTLIVILGYGVKNILIIPNKYILLGAMLFLYNLVISQVSMTMWMHKHLFLWLAICIILKKIKHEKMV
jgi:O-antigen ligase